MISVGVVGATGLVGSCMIDILRERRFPVDSFHPIASGRSYGKIINYNDTAYPLEIITEETFGKGMILLGATSAELALGWVPMALDAGAIIVDNSSAFRMRSDVPLIVPEVNGTTLKGTERLIANPNCSTIQLVMALSPLLQLGDIEWISVSTYQAVSGAGRTSLELLARQKKDKFTHEDAILLDGNVNTSIGIPGTNGFCGEEMKLMLETAKILSLDFPVFASAARVSVETGHTESVVVKFRDSVSPTNAVKILNDAPGVVYCTNGITPVDVEGTDDVFVDRLRVHPDDDSVLQFWVIADNLRKGAALNAVQIAEMLLIK